MLKLLLFILTLTCAAEGFAQPQTKCFRNDGLRDNHIVRFEADGGDVSGSYFVEPGGDARRGIQNRATIEAQTRHDVDRMPDGAQAIGERRRDRPA